MKPAAVFSTSFFIFLNIWRFIINENNNFFYVISYMSKIF